MLPNQIENFLTPLLQEKGITVKSMQLSSVGGGSINQTYHVTINDQQHYFLKQNKIAPLPGLFEKEAEGLNFLASQHCIAVPAVILSGTYREDQFLLLEWVEPGPKTEEFWKRFGEQLARLHTCTYPQFGFSNDNYMGALPQSNQLTATWSVFFAHERLLP